VSDALPERMRAAARQSMNQAYAAPTPARATKRSENPARKFQFQHPGAAAALREGWRRPLPSPGSACPNRARAGLD